MQNIFNDLSTWEQQLAISILVLAIVVSMRLIVLRVIRHRSADEEIRYRTQKLSAYAGTVIVIIAFGFIWLQAGDVGAWLGLASAGIAIALSDVLKNFAGWGFILFRRPFRVGDRIELGGHAGDVVDIRPFRFTVLEIRNWVDADQSTGRLLHIPNGLLFSTPVANYGEGFPFLWHEITMLVTFESDYRRAEEIMLSALDANAPDMATAQAQKAIREAAGDYRIKYTHLTPATYVTVKDSGVMVTGRLIVPLRSRRHVDSVIWRSLLDALAEEPSVELAYPTVRTYLPDRIKLDR
jgi:small-conductance mechanosensitive channel